MKSILFFLSLLFVPLTLCAQENFISFEFGKPLLFDYNGTSDDLPDDNVVGRLSFLKMGSRKAGLLAHVGINKFTNQEPIFIEAFDPRYIGKDIRYSNIQNLSIISLGVTPIFRLFNKNKRMFWVQVGGGILNINQRSYFQMRQEFAPTGYAESRDYYRYKPLFVPFIDFGFSLDIQLRKRLRMYWGFDFLNSASANGKEFKTKSKSENALELFPDFMHDEIIKGRMRSSSFVQYKMLLLKIGVRYQLFDKRKSTHRDLE